jgi:hypothetical protein
MESLGAFLSYGCAASVAAAAATVAAVALDQALGICLTTDAGICAQLVKMQAHISTCKFMNCMICHPALPCILLAGVS